MTAGVSVAQHHDHWLSELNKCSKSCIIPCNLSRHFKSLLKKLGLPETIRFHDLRHSCASLLIAQGEDLTVVKDILRHSQISVTADYYVHIVEKTQRRAIEGLDTLLGDDTVLELPPRKVRQDSE